MGDLDGFPAAPRRPRAGAWLRRGWPLGVLAAVLLLPAIAGAILFLANARDLLPLGDDALDASSSRTTGKVVASAPDDWPGGGGARITFRFEPRPGDAQVEASSFVPPEVRPPAVGTDVRIEFLPHAPELASARVTSTRAGSTVATLTLADGRSLSAAVRTAVRRSARTASETSPTTSTNENANAFASIWRPLTSICSGASCSSTQAE